MNEQDLEYEVIPSPHDTQSSVCVGVRVHHKPTKLTAQSTTEKSQYANKVLAVEKLKQLLKVLGREQEINPFDVADEVNADTSLSQDLLKQGNVLYSPNADMTHEGALKATYPNGDVEYGHFVNGEFVAVRKNKKR
ncbi:MAG: hypothetical protein GJ680_21175 [Alteromonadaceae bacterium]|nr:hypothetical protein [Alteromonadaceae bacterium]